LAEQSFPPNLELPLAHRSPHQFSDDGTLILIAEGFVELRLHFVGHAEIDGCHRRPQLLKSSTTIRESHAASIAISGVICQIILSSRRFWQYRLPTFAIVGNAYPSATLVGWLARAVAGNRIPAQSVELR
jgi:hypothetical protein